MTRRGRHGRSCALGQDDDCQLLVEAKLTENDFQAQKGSIAYRDFRTVFEVSALPRLGDEYISYQLIRNVLAADAAGLSFCVITDACRRDLIEAWYAIVRCIRDAELRTRCKVLMWQELSSALPHKLQRFLGAKYGIFGRPRFLSGSGRTLRRNS